MTLMVFGVFFVLLALSVPICFAMGFATITPALLDPGFMADLQFVVRSMIKGVDSTPILYVKRSDYGNRRSLQETVRCVCCIHW